MKALKKSLKIAAFVLASILALVILVIVILNIAKFAIYNEYYDMKTNLCKNPGLNDGFICQGIAAVDDKDIILISGYMKDDSASRIYVTTLDNDSYYVTLNNDGEKYTGHAGGISTSNGSVYIANGSKIFTFSLDSVLNAKNGEDVNIGKGTKINNKASFLYTDDEYLYVGSFMDKGTKKVDEHIFQTQEGTHYAICSQYKIDDLSTPVRIYSIRDYVQGICFTPDGKIVLSTSHGLTSSVYYVYDKNKAVDSGKTLDGAPVYYLDSLENEIKGPAMAEGLDYYNGKIITLTESASNKYIFGKFFFANKIVSLEIK
ncbi:MAG: hypothetical protein J6A95_05090 [Clostridia bacterium]|nr:hypothetical protein [Clostridia bacterium]